MEKPTRSYSDNILSFFHPTSSPPLLNEKSLFSDFLQTDCLTQTNVLLKFNQEWAISDHCFICSQIFDKRKMHFEHHCRLCGGPVCGVCSRHQVNKERVCDACFLKLISKEHSKEWESILLDKDYNIEFLSKMIEPIEEEVKKLEKEGEKEQEKNTDIWKKQNEGIQNLMEEVKKLEERKDLLKYENGKLGTKLDEFKQIIVKKTKEWETYKNMDTLVDTENIIKREAIKPKEADFIELKKRQNLKAKELIELNKLDDADQEYQKSLIEHLKSPLRRIENNKNDEKCSVF